MARALTGWLPEEFWYPRCKWDVIRFLKKQPAPANARRDWLFHWALWVGCTINKSEYSAVTAGSIEAGPF